MQHSLAAVQGTPSLLQICDVPQTPVPRHVFGEQQSELATHAAPLPLHVDWAFEELLWPLQPARIASANASPTSWGRNEVGMAPDLRP